MHVVFVQPLLPKYAISFFNRLALIDGVEVTVLADLLCDKQLNQYEEGHCLFTAIHLEDRTFSRFVIRPNLGKILTTLTYDYLILNAAPRDLSQFYRLVISRIKGERVFTWGMFHRIGRKKFLSEFYYKIAGKLSIACLTYTKKGINSQLMRGINGKKLIEIGTALDEKEIISEKNKRTVAELNDFKNINGLNDKKVVLQVVRLSSIKKPHLLIEAAEILLKIKPNIVFILIGGGDLELDLKNKVTACGISNSVFFLGPIYDEKILSFWFLSADVFVIPSCIGLSAHHAMCYGLPIITDNDYDHQASEFEILSDGLNAVLYEANSVEKMSSKIYDLLDDEEKYKFISDNAFYTVTKINNLDSKVSNIVNALKRFEK